MAAVGNHIEPGSAGGLRLLLATVSRSMVATLLLMGAVTGVLLLYVAAHARLAASEYEYKRLQTAQREETERHRRLTVDLAQATAPDRIRAEAARMGLVQYASTDIERVRAVVPPDVEAPAPVSGVESESPHLQETAVALREAAPEPAQPEPTRAAEPVRALSTGL